MGAGGGFGDCGGCSESVIRQYIMRESRDSHRWGGGADGVCVCVLSYISENQPSVQVKL